MNTQLEKPQSISNEKSQDEDEPVISNSAFVLLVLCSSFAGAVIGFGLIFATGGM